MNAPMPNVPGPEADATALRRHYALWLAVTSGYNYETRIYACGWCARTDIDLEVRRPGRREPLFCCERCRDAKVAYEEKCWPKPEVSEEDLERAEAREQERRRRATREDEGKVHDYGTGAVRV